MTEPVEPTQEPVTPDTSAGTPNTEPQGVEQTVPYARFQEINRRAREMEERLAQIERDEQERTRLEAESREEYKTLYEQEKTRREQAERDREAERIKTLRATIGAKHGLPARLVSRLQGNTEEEIEADAAALAEDLPKPAAPNIDSPRSRTPAPTKPFKEMTWAEKEALQESDPELFRKLAYS